MDMENAKKITVLGATGSIGRQTLDVIRHSGGRLVCFAVCVDSNTDELNKIIKEFSPAYAGVADKEAAKSLRAENTGIIVGENAASEIAALDEADIVVNGISGFSGTAPLLEALDAGKTVALANKESIVCAGKFVKTVSTGKKGRIIPVDSEQSAIFQCLAAGRTEDVSRLILTASGGPFREYSVQQLETVTPEQALRHPTWNMGRKITVDSATLFNKGLEVMEASYLFDMPADRIDVLIHPQSIVHSMVEYKDGCIMAQMSVPDMRLAIQYAINFPERTAGPVKRLELSAAGGLTFHKPDNERFPALELAYAALRENNALPIAYNGANEAAVDLFLKGEIGFTDIVRCVEYSMNCIDNMHIPEVSVIEDVYMIDRLSRNLVKSR